MIAEPILELWQDYPLWRIGRLLGDDVGIDFNDHWQDGFLPLVNSGKLGDVAVEDREGGVEFRGDGSKNWDHYSCVVDKGLWPDLIEGLSKVFVPAEVFLQTQHPVFEVDSVSIVIGFVAVFPHAQ